MRTTWTDYVVSKRFKIQEQVKRERGIKVVKQQNTERETDINIK